MAACDRRGSGTAPIVRQIMILMETGDLVAQITRSDQGCEPPPPNNPAISAITKKTALIENTTMPHVSTTFGLLGSARCYRNAGSATPTRCL